MNVQRGSVQLASATFLTLTCGERRETTVYSKGIVEITCKNVYAKKNVLDAFQENKAETIPDVPLGWDGNLESPPRLGIVENIPKMVPDHVQEEAKLFPPIVSKVATDEVVTMKSCRESDKLKKST